MALAAKRDARMSVAEFKLWAEPVPDRERWELLDGEPVLRAPPGERHQTIVSNLIRRLGDLADPRGCRALPGLAVLSAGMDDFAPIPTSSRAAARCSRTATPTIRSWWPRCSRRPPR